MKLTTLKENLHKALSTASKFSAKKQELPILGNILLEAKKNKLNIASTNLESSFSTSIGARVEKEGKISIPASTITDIVSTISSQQIELEVVEENLKISSNGFKANLSALNASDFPEIPHEITTSHLSLPAGSFQKALSQLLFAVSRDETRPTLTGILFDFNQDLTLASSDGFRLSQKIFSTKIKSKPDKFIIPRTILSEIQKIASNENEIQILPNKKENQVVFGISNSIFSTRLIEGDFPDYKKIIPSSYQTSVSTSKEDLQNSIKLASIIARQSTNTIKLSVKKDVLEIFSESPNAGVQNSTIPAKVEGFDIDIQFNYRFIEEFLNVSESEDVVMEFGSSDSPGVFKDSKNTDFLHIIMPIKSQ